MRLIKAVLDIRKLCGLQGTYHMQIRLLHLLTDTMEFTKEVLNVHQVNFYFARTFPI